CYAASRGASQVLRETGTPNHSRQRSLPESFFHPNPLLTIFILRGLVYSCPQLTGTQSFVKSLLWMTFDLRWHAQRHTLRFYYLLIQNSKNWQISHATTREHAHALAEAEKCRTRTPRAVYHFDGAAFGDAAGAKFAVAAVRDRAGANHRAGAQLTRRTGMGYQLVEPPGHLGRGHGAE